jgi:phosphoribosylamine--glycine ligase
MNILLIGSGAREHALAKQLHTSPSCSQLFASPGNPGIAQCASLVQIDVSNHEAVLTFCKENSIALVVVGPEQPLADGLSDFLTAAGIAVFGPSKAAAQLESSKGFAKSFMQRHNIPTAGFQHFTQDSIQEAHTYIEEQALPIVLKADGLAAGKGVVIAETHEDAKTALQNMFSGQFGTAGESVVIEQFLHGEECSVFAICDGEDFITLLPSQDHKRAFDGDKGPNTGGMGAYCPAPIATEATMKLVHETIIAPVLKGMKEEGNPFVGCLYAGLMIHEGKPSVVEFNVRFGDPETQCVLELTQGDFAKLLLSAAQGNLDSTALNLITDHASCCLVLASEGYPGSYPKGLEISGIAEAEGTSAFVFHAGTKKQEDKLATSGGRVLSVVSVAPTLQEARDITYSAADKISFEGKIFRTDIAMKALS